MNLIELPHCRICWVTDKDRLLKNCQTHNGYMDCEVFYPHHDFKRVDLPHGNWQIVGRASEITEEQAREIVELLTPGHPISLWMNYKYKKPLPVTFTCTTALESFHSLTTAYNIPKDALLMIERK